MTAHTYPYRRDPVTGLTTSVVRPLYMIAADIHKNWPKVNFAAMPYLDAMYRIERVTDTFGLDNAESIVRYFLGNATSWRGSEAKRIKAELKSMLN